MKWPQGSEYHGTFVDGRRHGHGRMRTEDGHEFEGEFHDDERVRGQLTLPSGAIYNGEFRGGLKHGEGQYIWRRGEEYSGPWVKGKCNGVGRMSYADGGSYTGMFVDNVRHG